MQVCNIFRSHRKYFSSKYLLWTATGHFTLDFSFQFDNWYDIYISQKLLKLIELLCKSLYFLAILFQRSSLPRPQTPQTPQPPQVPAPPPPVHHMTALTHIASNAPMGFATQPIILSAPPRQIKRCE